MGLSTHLWCLHGRDTTVKVSLSASPARQREGEQPRDELHEKKLSFYFNAEQPQGRRKAHKAKLKSKDQEQTTTTWGNRKSPGYLGEEGQSHELTKEKHQEHTLQWQDTMWDNNQDQNHTTTEDHCLWAEWRQLLIGGGDNHLVGIPTLIHRPRSTRHTSTDTRPQALGLEHTSCPQQSSTSEQESSRLRRAGFVQTDRKGQRCPHSWFSRWTGTIWEGKAAVISYSQR